MKFPATLPPDCPLPSALDCAGTVYMVFSNTPFTEDQCKSQAERNRALNAKGDGVCTRHGLSVFPTVVGCRNHRSLFPRLGTFMGAANLTAVHGKIAPTPSSTNPEHATWWPYESVIRHGLFNLVEED